MVSAVSLSVFTSLNGWVSWIFASSTESFSPTISHALCISNASRASLNAFGKICIVSLFELFHRHVGILKRMHMPREEVSERVGTILFDNRKRVDDVSKALAHLLPTARDKAMVDDALCIR